jgi:hypothetical protein
MIAKTDNPQGNLVALLAPLLAGLYAWLAAVSFGFVCLDVLYARLVPAAPAAFSQLSDLLLIVTALTMLTALAAIILAWPSKRARNLLAASLLVSLFGLLALPLLSAILPQGSAWGTALRIALRGSVSIPRPDLNEV